MAASVLGVVVSRRLGHVVEDATIDSLTQVLTRSELDRLLGCHFRHLCRCASPLSLLLIDLDGLKGINDSQGHLAGDEALRLVGESLRRTLRSSDWVARYGGDEFVVVAPRTGPCDAVFLADRLRVTLKSLAATSHLLSTPTVSIGAVATSTLAAGGAVPQEALFDAADQALYLSKHMGGDRVNLGRITWPLLAPFEMNRFGSPQS